MFYHSRDACSTIESRDVLPPNQPLEEILSKAQEGCLFYQNNYENS
ncbi:MAG: hypothetical protein ACPGWR_26395 [Ardenticatenaceae bacterium]